MIKAWQRRLIGVLLGIGVLGMGVQETDAQVVTPPVAANGFAGGLRTSTYINAHFISAHTQLSATTNQANISWYGTTIALAASETFTSGTGTTLVVFGTSGPVYVGAFNYGTTTTIGTTSVSTTGGGTAYLSMFGSYFIQLEANGIVEFDLAGLPAAWMTASNFAATLGGLSATYSSYYNLATMPVNLFDLADGAEDGVIDTAGGDFAQALGGAIASRTHTFGGAPANFNGINVTAQLRRDLFGAGTGQPTTGFILRPGAIPLNSMGRLGYSAPTLTIRAKSNTPPKMTKPLEDIWAMKGDFPVTINLFPYVEDAEEADAALTYTILSNSNDRVAQATIETGGNLQVTFDKYGVTQLVIRVTDRKGLFVDLSVTVRVIFRWHFGGSLQDMIQQIKSPWTVGNAPADQAVQVELPGPEPR